MKENRTEVIKVRLTKEEKERLAKRVKLEGILLSTYVRKSILGENIVSKTDIQVVFELKKIGVNINQLAKHVNTLPINENIIDAIGRIDLYMKELKSITDRIL